MKFCPKKMATASAILCGLVQRPLVHQEGGTGREEGVRGRGEGRR